MHMTANPVPSRRLMLATLDSIVESVRHEEENTVSEQHVNGWRSIVLVGHSYGTFASGWVVRDCVDDFENPDHKPTLHTQIAHLILIDSIPILLSHPSVAHNFVYRDPWTVFQLDAPAVMDDEPRDSDGISTEFDVLLKKPARARASAAAWQLWYFASRDADVSRTLGRAFFWTEGGLWREDLNLFMHGAGMKGKDQRKRNVAVVLGGCDQIVPTEAVRRHLTGELKPKRKWVGRLGATHTHLDNHLETDSEGGQLELLFYPELDHANVFESRESLSGILDVLRRYVNDV